MMPPHDEFTQGKNTLSSTMKPQSPRKANTVKWLKKLKLFARVLFYIPLTLLVLLAILINTPLGTRASVYIANEFIESLTVSYHSGTLNNNLQLSHASWHMQGIEVEVNNLQIDWNPVCFIYKQICVKSLAATKVNVGVYTDQFYKDDTNELDSSNINNSHQPLGSSASSTEPLNQTPTDDELRLPFDITLTSLNLSEVNVQINDMHFGADTLTGSAIWNEPGLQVEYITSTGLFATIPLAGVPSNANANATQNNNTTSKTNAASSATHNDKASSPKSASTQATSENDNSQWPLAQLPHAAMPFPLFVKSLQAQNSTLTLGERTDIFHSIEISGHYIRTEIDVTRLYVDHTYGDITINGDINLTDDYPMDILASANVLSIDELPGFNNQQIKLNLENGFTNLNLSTQISGSLNLDLNGQFNFAAANLPFNLSIKNSQLYWPLIDPKYQSDIAQLEAHGDIDQQVFNVKGSFDSPYHPLLLLESQGQHEHLKLDLALLDIHSSAGKLLADGFVDFNTGIKWAANLNAEALMLQHLTLLQDYSILQSEISGRLSTTGHVEKDQWQVALTDTNLDGQLNQYPLNIQGDISIDNHLAINAQNMEATALGAVLLVNGRANQDWDLDAELTLPDLGLWLDNAAGSIYGKIDVTGDSEQPQVAVNADIDMLQYLSYSIERLNLTGHYQPLNAHQYTAEITIDDANLHDISLNAATLTSRGDELSQHTELVSRGDINLHTELDTLTQLDAQLIEGSLTRLDIDKILGLWQLQDTLHFKWDQLAKTGQVDAFCLFQRQHQLCLENDMPIDEAGQANVNFTGELGDALQPLLPENVQWQGQADIKANVAWSAEKKPTAALSLIMPAGEVVLNPRRARANRFQYQSLALDAELNASQLTANVHIQSDGIAQIDADIAIDTSPARTLQGNIDIKEIQLTPLSSFFPQLSTLEGSVFATLSLGGSLHDPLTKGSIEIQDGAIALATNPTLLDEINANLKLKGKTATFSSQWQMGDGAVQSTGNLYWPNGQFAGNIDIEGDKLAIIQPPLAILDVSPDINIVFDTKRLAITGDVNIPSGQITIVQLAEDGIALSNDVVFDDSISAKQEAAPAFEVNSKLNINVGKELKIDGMGLQGKLEGTLLLQQNASQPPLVFGDIRVTNGSYKFMGQTLSIDKGELQFSGPTEIANLDIEATKEIKEEDLIAGVRVTGTSLQPEVTIFSSPAKEQAEVLSYILTGKGFSNASNEQNNALMMSAALSLGSQFGGGAIDNIGSTATNIIEKFGFSNVQLDANDDGRVAVSGFIGDSLMIKYGIGVFDPGYEMTVRYYILSQLYLESVSGTLSQSLDIYYSFDIE